MKETQVFSKNYTMTKPLFSVVICTYNRATLLEIALRTVCQQHFDQTQFEVLVVDNNSKDTTKEVFNTYNNQFPNVRYVLETKQGLSHARNRGWQEAKGHYVVYVDDDCKMPTEWLTGAYKLIQEFSPDVFGGPYFGFYLTTKPSWIKPSYVSHEPYPSAQFIKTSDALHGGNLFIRRELLAATNGFDASLGMNGKKVAYGEETELLKRIEKTIPKSTFYYDPKVYVYHLVRPEKMTIKWLIKQRFRSGQASYQIYNKEIHKRSKFSLAIAILKKILFILYSLIFRTPFRNKTQFPYILNYLHEVVSRQIWAIGWLYATYQNTPYQTK